MKVKIEKSWEEALSREWDSEYFSNLTTFVKESYGRGHVCPKPSRIFAAFDSCPLDKIKVVILGQDPYHGAGQANGLCFAVNEGVAVPPSLVNIFKEIESDLGIKTDNRNGNLERWARQGVLLMNSTLTVEEGRAGSHQGRGWERFTDAAISAINEKCEGVVFLLWGSYAIRKGELIDRNKHLVLTSPHPSPLSAHRGFFGNHHFSQANKRLIELGKEPIDWR